MTTTKSDLIPLQIVAGVQPSTDKTPLASLHYSQADKIRFRFGLPQKIGGWYSIVLANGAAIVGAARTIFSAILSSSINTLIGTSSKIYSISGSFLTNITPLQTATIAIANSLATDYGTLAANPIATTTGSGTLTIADSHAADYMVGDTIEISGATAFNGITTGQLNAQHVIHTITIGHYTVITGGTATASSSGGGSSVVRSTGRLTITATAHGQPNGNRVGILGAADTGGIVAATFINQEFIIRNVTTNTFDVMTGGIATSSVTGGGGSATTYQIEIPVGAVNQSIGQGYGMGLYGIGLYGTALLSSELPANPRIWFIDRFGQNVVMTPGNQGSLYTWNGEDAHAPVLIANAPTAVNYAFVSNNILVTFGAGGIPNRIFSSDQTNNTQWTSSSSNQVFDDTVVGAGTFVSHIPVTGGNLIFTPFQTYTFAYTGYNAGTANGIWAINQIENNIGIISAMARCAVNGIAYWMGQHNFYMWAGGNVTIIPANSQTESTILDYVFKNINRGQAAKCFAWYNEQFNEVWFHYASASSNEPDSVARVCLSDFTWVPDSFDRICAEYPNLILGYPRLISSESIFYAHEQGTDADGAAMPWSLTSNLRCGDFVKNYNRTGTKKTSLITGFVPDSIQTENITLEIIARRFPQSSVMTYDQTYTVTPTTEQQSVEVGGRFWQYKLSGSALGQVWKAGQWMEYVQEGTNQ